MKPEFEEDFTTEDVTERATRIIKTFVKGSIYPDEFFQYLQRLFEKVRVVEFTHKKDPIKFYWYELIEKEDVPFSWLIEVKTVEKETLKVNTHTPIFQLSEEDFRYNNISLVIKEVKDWYFSFRTHSYVDDESWMKIEKQYKLWQDVTVVMQGTKILSVDANTTIYDTAKHDGEWWVMKDWERISKVKDFKQVEVFTDTTNHTTTYKLYWAYTHLLRATLGFYPQSWQYKFLISQKRLCTVAGVRRGGKTLLSSYLIMRELYRNPNDRNKSRQVKALYVAPKEEQYKSVLDYIDNATEKIKELKVFKWAKDEKRLKLVDESVVRKKVHIQVIATCDFASAKGYEPARGNGADFVLIDEAGFIHQDVYLNVLPILENEQAKLFTISTIDWNTPKNWFYELLCSYELWEDPEGYAQRVTIDDIDENIMSANSKERMKMALKSDTQRYFAELYATFPQMNSVFSTQNLFMIPEVPKDVQEVIIWYDPARRSDFGWVVVWLITPDKLTIIEEHRLQGDYSITQKEFLLALKQKYQSRFGICSVIIDATAIGDVIADSFGTIIDFKLWYTSWQTSRPEIDRFGTWKFAKKNLVHLNQSMIDLRMLQAYNTLEYLSEELKNFKWYTTQSGNIKYESITGHDDIVNAMMLCGFYYGYIAGRYHKVAEENTREYKELFGMFDFETNLPKRIPWQKRETRENTHTSYYF